MGRIVYETAASFDGYIADEHHSVSWLFAVPGGGDPALEPPQAAVQVMGSTTYEWVLIELNALKHPSAWTNAFGGTHVVVFTMALGQGTRHCCQLESTQTGSP